MSRILVIGISGQIGAELVRSLSELGEVIGVDRAKMDLSKPDAIRQVIREVRPDVVVNAAAYTAVDLAESEPELAMTVNGVAPGILAEEAKKLGAALIHYSTDYVFDGSSTTPYTEEDAPQPLNSYGRRKLAGERAIQSIECPHLVLRTGWVYGTRGKNFMLTMLRLAKERDELRVVNDQIGAPTSSRAIAKSTAAILRKLDFGHAEFAGKFATHAGTYHLTAIGQTSWFGFATEIFFTADRPDAVTPDFAVTKSPVLRPISMDDYPQQARRPRYCVLAGDKMRRVFGLEMAEWQIELRAIMSG